MSDKNLRIRPETWKRAQVIVKRLGNGLAVPTLLHHAIAVFLANAEQGNPPPPQNRATPDSLLEHNLAPADLDALDKLAAGWKEPRSKIVTEIIQRALLPNDRD